MQIAGGRSTKRGRPRGAKRGGNNTIIDRMMWPIFVRKVETIYQICTYKIRMYLYM